MSAAQLLEELTARGVKVWAEGSRLRCGGPKSVVTPEVVAELKEHKNDLLRALSDDHPLDCPCLDCLARAPSYAKIKATGEVLEMARGMFGTIEDPVTPPAPPGRDPLAKHGTDKERFFGEGWRAAEPKGFRVHRPGGAT